MIVLTPDSGYVKTSNPHVNTLKIIESTESDEYFQFALSSWGGKNDIS